MIEPTPAVCFAAIFTHPKVSERPIGLFEPGSAEHFACHIAFCSLYVPLRARFEDNGL
jgi:hypothetical protein